ncbi:MAG: LytTR family DNA-binding domain-containing protein [Candidatus Izemoplasmatales bacterium]|nr:LytTR family DNA-binding domain-containing protein [Bacteroidales bacterium]MDZ4197625.1 LytTR family DNA-binding domain-containing protein [Candidatus Izemoplasmatales bacterium]
MENYRIVTLIVEDDMNQRQLLEGLIQANHPEVQVVGTCSSGAEALSTLQTIRPDLLLLDIDLGDMSAFDLLGYLKEHPFHIIFTTAFNEYALQAFRVHAIDYLLKPIDNEELAAALSKVVNKKNRIQSYSELISDLQQLNKRYLSIRENEHVVYIPVQDIIYVEEVGNEVCVHFTETKKRHKLTSNQTIASVENELFSHEFIRIHPKYLVSPSQIRSYNKASGKLKIASGDALEVSKNMRWFFEKS